MPKLAFGICRIDSPQQPIRNMKVEAIGMPRAPFQAMPKRPLAGVWKCLAAATVFSKVVGYSILSLSNRSVRAASNSIVQ